MIRPSVLAASFILVFGLSSSAHALIPNGDFEQGDLTGYFVQEDFLDVASSPLIQNVDDGTGNRVGELSTGFTEFGVTQSSLVRDFGTLPADVQDLVFDVRFFDAGEDNDPILALGSSPEFLAAESLDPDILIVSYGSDSGGVFDLFNVTAADFRNNKSTHVEPLSNGFLRVKSDLSGLSGATNFRLYYDLRDGDDQRLSKVQLDNIDLTSVDKSVVPEPATMLLMSGGLLGFGYLRNKKLV